MADTAKAKEQLESIVKLFTTGELVKTAALVVIPGDMERPSAKWSLSNRIIQAMHGTGDARGIKQWNNVGRSVKAGSKAFCILGPSIVKDKKDPEKTILVGFHAIPVFRMEDTKGDPLPTFEPPSPPPLLEVAKAFGLEVFYTPFSGSYYGSYSQGKSQIMLCTHETEVFFHELGHAAHNKIVGQLKGGQDAEQEIIAEMTACVLSRVYGVPSHEDKMREYVRAYAGDKDLGKVLIKLLSMIQKTVNLIIETANAEAQKIAA